LDFAVTVEGNLLSGTPRARHQNPASDFSNFCGRRACQPGRKIAESVSTSSNFSFRLALECTSLRQRIGLEAVSDALGLDAWMLRPIVKLD